MRNNKSQIIKIFNKIQIANFIKQLGHYKIKIYLINLSEKNLKKKLLNKMKNLLTKNP